jgi:hypothetical protein
MATHINKPETVKKIENGINWYRVPEVCLIPGRTDRQTACRNITLTLTLTELQSPIHSLSTVTYHVTMSRLYFSLLIRMLKVAWACELSRSPYRLCNLSALLGLACCLRQATIGFKHCTCNPLEQRELRMGGYISLAVLSAVYTALRVHSC